jgi:hypothetical protein
MNLDDATLYKIKSIEGVTGVSKVIEEKALKWYRDKDRPPFVGNFRDIVQFKSNENGEEKILNAYRSSSELGIWRLGYLRTEDCGLKKFELDYVQGTLLHHLLQKIINENFINLPTIPHETSGTILMKEHVSNKQYLTKKNYYELNSEEQEQFIKSHGFIMLKFPSIEEEEEIDSISRKVQMVPFSDITIKCHNKVKEREINTQLEDLSSKIQSVYVIGRNNFINSYDFEEVNENIRSTISIYTINLNTELLDNNVTLVYCKYKLIYNSKESSGYYGIALLKTNDSKVNKYGIYEKFIDSGIFICKPVSYLSTCDMDEEELEKKRCSKTYIYVGDRYTNIYPYSVLDGLSIESGGKKRYKKRSKKRSKKRYKKKSKKSKK